MVSEIKSDKLLNQSGDQDSGIDLSTNDVVKVNIAGSEKMRVHSDGNVGIGTTPNTEFHVRGAGTVANFEGTGGNSFIQLTDSDDSTQAFIGVDGGTFKIQTSDSSYSDEVTIDTGGTSIFNCLDTANVAMYVNNLASSGTPELCLWDTPNYSKDSTGGHFLKCDDSTTTRMVIDLNGSLRNHDNSYGSLSDERIKQDISDASSQWDDIKAVKVRKYKKKDDVAQYKDKAWEQIGVIAQELEASGMDKLVDIDNESEEKWKSVKYSVLYMKAIKALQEAMIRIETLETKVKALEDK